MKLFLVATDFGVTSIAKAAHPADELIKTTRTTTELYDSQVNADFLRQVTALEGMGEATGIMAQDMAPTKDHSDWRW